MIRFELIDPLGFVDASSRILRESWRPPCLDYAPDYLRWQWGAPGACPPIGVVALDADEPVGFAAAIPRRVRFRGESRDVVLVSFVAVRPAWRGLGVAGGLYAVLLAAVGESGLPVVTFAQPGTAGQKVLERAYAAAGFRLQSLGTYRGHGLIVRPEAPVRESSRTELADEADIASLAGIRDDSTLWADPTASQREHDRADPRPRATIVARDPVGEVIGGVTVVRADMVNAQGAGAVALIVRIALAEPNNEDVLQALLQAAGRRWPGVAIVSVPNVCGLAPERLRPAGLRQTPSCFDGYLASADPSDPLLHASSTNLEVV